MVLLIIAGLFALIFGKIGITKEFHLVGKKARIYGVLLMVLAVPYSYVITKVLVYLLPASLLFSSYSKPIIDLILGLAIVIGLAIPFKEKKRKIE